MAVVYVGGSSGYATLQQGIQAAELSGAHTIVVNSGTYTGNGVLSSADNGLTIFGSPGATIDGTVVISNALSITVSGLSFQGDGSSSAITAFTSQDLTITGNIFTGAGQAVVLDGSTHSAVSSNTMLNTTASAIEAMNGANSNVITSNVINGDSAAGTVGAIWLHGANDSTITHNQITNTTGAAISLADFYGPGTTATQNNGGLIAFNSLDHVDTAASDSGAIYILGRSQDPSTNISVTGNYIGVTGGTPVVHAVGIYLDDNASGVSITRNIVVASPTMTDPWEIHGGSNNTITGNIFDITSDVPDFGLSQNDQADEVPQGSAQLQHDNITGNIYVTEASMPHNPGYADLTSGIGNVHISGNDYWAFSGAPLNVAGSGAAGDDAAHYNPPAAAPAQSLGDYASWSGAGIGFQAIDVSQIGVTQPNPTLVTEPASILLLPLFMLALLLLRHRRHMLAPQAVAASYTRADARSRRRAGF